MTRIAEKMKEGVSSGVFPGGVVLVDHQAKVLFHEAFGSESSLSIAAPVTCETLFDLASLTKPLATAAALLLLTVERQLTLSDPLSKFIPEFAIGASARKEVTLRHLLNHSSGLPDWRPYYQEIVKREEKAPGFLGSPEAKEAVYQMAHEEPLLELPGATARYSDIGFILLGEVIEKVAQEPLHRFCDRHILAKIGCKETSFIRRGEMPPVFQGRSFSATEAGTWRGELIRGAVHDDNAYVMGGVAGHAGLFSTAREVYRLVRFWLDSIGGKGPLDPELAALFVSRQEGSGLPAGTSWGLGWDTPSSPQSSSGQFFSSASFGHLGFTGTSIWVDRKKDLIVILLTNRVHPSRENRKIRAFRPALHDLIFQEVVGG
jgi:CubicO group peptidase (beta-lactamase class C family)